MKNKNTNNLIVLLNQYFKKYKYFCIFYLICLALLYPTYYYIKDHNIKYYNFSYDLSSTSPLIIRQNKPKLNLKRLNMSMNNEIYNQVYSLPVKKDTRVEINCSPNELQNSCIIKIKNGNFQLINSINDKIISAVSAVDIRYKDKLNENIKRYEMDIKIFTNSSEKLEKIIDNRNIQITEAADISNIFSILKNNSLQVNELRSEINLLRTEVTEIENFVELIKENLNDQKLKIVNDAHFANYSVKSHLLSFIVGCILMVFSFLILIRD